MTSIYYVFGSAIIYSSQKMKAFGLIAQSLIGSGLFSRY